MPTPAAFCRRFAAHLRSGGGTSRPKGRGTVLACAAALTLCAALATTAGAPAARADGRALLAGAIANTRGSYLVYNFGAGHPAPMLNAGGGWYEMNNGGHLMTIKNAAGRLRPKLLVDTHQGFQARCERDAGARTGEGLWQASEVFAPQEAWQALGQPTIAINANFFDVRGQKGGRGATPSAARRSARTSTTPAARAGPTPRSPAPLPTPASRVCRAAMNTGRHWPR